jgi:hypothetical protein
MPAILIGYDVTFDMLSSSISAVGMPVTRRPPQISLGWRTMLRYHRRLVNTTAAAPPPYEHPRSSLPDQFRVHVEVPVVHPTEQSPVPIPPVVLHPDGAPEHEVRESLLRACPTGLLQLRGVDTVQADLEFPIVVEDPDGVAVVDGGQLAAWQRAAHRLPLAASSTDGPVRSGLPAYDS